MSHALISPARAMVFVLALAAAAGCAKKKDADESAAPQAAATAAPAELAFKNGAIYTVDGPRRWADAVAIRGGHIVFVGTDLDLEKHIGPDTRVVDLKGRMLLPGFQDAHVHPISAGTEAVSCDLNGLETAEQYVAKIKEYSDAHPEAEWITGGGWLMSAFGPGARARRELIDAVVPDRPVVLSSTDGHTTWVNSKALEIAGITKDTPDPPDGRIDRDPRTGEAVGSLQEGAASLVRDKVPPSTPEQLQAGLRYAIKYLNALGITGIQDASVDEPDLKTYQTLDQAGELTLHVVGSIWWERDQGLEQIDTIKRLSTTYTKGQVDARTVKIMQDGVIENYTAVVLEPYKLPGKAPSYGIPMVDPEKHLVPELGLLGVEIDAQIAAKVDGLRAPYGVIVVARTAGTTSEVPLQAQDVIRSVNGKDVSTLQGLSDAVRGLPSGSPVTLQVQREGRLMYVTFTHD